MGTGFERRNIAAVITEVLELRAALVAAEAARAADIAATHPRHRRSAANLIHYVELRQHDVRELQQRLAELGLSSLGRSEPHVLATVEAVLHVLFGLLGEAAPATRAAVAIGEGWDVLAANATALLGRPPVERSTRIMVTLPSEAASDPTLVAGLLHSGMDLARVNCAHDDATAWDTMITAVRSHSAESGRRCLVAMDLAGPKLRTGPLMGDPGVVRVAPDRDRLGQTVAPGLVWLSSGDPCPGGLAAGRRVAEVPVTDRDWLRRRAVDDRVRLTDARDADRTWRVQAVTADGCLASAKRSTYVLGGLRLRAERIDEPDDFTTVGALPAQEQVHRVVTGDRITLCRSLDPMPGTGPGEEHRIGCTLPEVLDHARPGERIWLDDGKIGARIESANSDFLHMRVTEVKPGGANLRGAKGINLPDTETELDALTEKDLVDLDFVAAHADLVSLSFVRHTTDVLRLQAELAARGAPETGIVLKIENLSGFEHLPDLLLAAMRSERVGVMIARGDLAVEVGFERLVEVQEEILWACEAAHVPVIWATQVLDTLARTGLPSRAEVTDAAMGERAECVMLNKGPHIEQAMRVLDSILSRMQHHQNKKRSLLRRLRAWDHNGGS